MTFKSAVIVVVRFLSCIPTNFDTQTLKYENFPFKKHFYSTFFLPQKPENKPVFNPPAVLFVSYTPKYRRIPVNWRKNYSTFYMSNNASFELLFMLKNQGWEFVDHTNQTTLRPISEKQKQKCHLSSGREMFLARETPAWRHLTDEGDSCTLDASHSSSTLLPTLQ
jgi:hypothetical protein